MASDANAGGTATKEKKTQQPRPYKILSEITVDLGGSDADIANAVREAFGSEGKTPVLGIVGSAMQTTARKALAAVAEAKTLNGDFQIIADAAVTKLSVKVETKTKASIS